MQAGPIGVVEVIAVIDRDEVDLTALGQIDRLIEKQASAANLGSERERHGVEYSTVADAGRATGPRLDRRLESLDKNWLLTSGSVDRPTPVGLLIRVGFSVRF